MKTRTKKKKRFDWVDALKGMALLAILFNHFVEEFSRPFGLAFPLSDWANISLGGKGFFETGSTIIWLLGRTFAWIGDHGPGIFILLSGFALSYSSYANSKRPFSFTEFYQRRLLRIFPLYIIIQFITLIALFFVLGQNIDWDRSKIFLSFLGIRASDQLFFLFNPSWWFIWLILQLYLLFPFLLWLQKKTGVFRFFLISLAFMAISGFLGMMDIRYSGSYYNWLTGIFFGTRLAEFTAGMCLAVFAREKKGFTSFGLKPAKILLYSFILLVTGSAFSLNRLTAIFSNLLITLGLSGIFYYLYILLIKRNKNRINKVLIWMGLYSYGIYLIHQAPLQWTGIYFTGVPHLLAAIIVLGVMIFLGWFIEKWLNKLKDKWLRTAIPDSLFKKLFFIVIGFVFGGLMIIDPLISDERLRTLFDLLLIASFFLLILISFKLPNGTQNNIFKLLIPGTLILVVFSILIFPPRLGDLSALLCMVIVFLSLVFYWIICKPAISFLLAIGSSILLFAASEVFLKHEYPIETARWGEFPALEKHPTRTYGLIPNKTTHLKYNNYDYVLKTNSLGLASPEISAERPTPDSYRILIIGDAFSMPEGMEYEFAYPYLLEQSLNHLHPNRITEVINGGVTGYGPIEESAQLAELAPQFKPNLVIYQFFINEFTQVNQQDSVERLEKIGFSEKPFSVPTWLNTNSQLAEHFKKLQGSFILGLSKTQSAGGYDKSLLAYYEKDNHRLYNKKSLHMLNDYLKKMRAVCTDNDAEFIILFVPGQVAVSNTDNIAYFPKNIDLADTSKFNLAEPFNNLKEIAQKLGIALFDVTKQLKDYPDQPVYFEESWHWNKNGHRAVSDYLFRLIEKKKYMQL